jgi:hypothetical protein
MDPNGTKLCRVVPEEKWIQICSTAVNPAWRGQLGILKGKLFI